MAPLHRQNRTTIEKINQSVSEKKKGKRFLPPLPLDVSPRSNGGELLQSAAELRVCCTMGWECVASPPPPSTPNPDTRIGLNPTFQSDQGSGRLGRVAA